MEPLKSIEHWIEQLVEEPFVRIFAARLLPQEVAKRLLRALEDGEYVAEDGAREVPGRYLIALNPTDLAALMQHHPDLRQQLAEGLLALTERLAVRLQEPPSVVLQADTAIPLRSVQITPAERVPPLTEATRELDVHQVELIVEQEESGAPKAYLVVDGSRTYELNEPMVRIGRALDNDLILEDRRVSRYHAQLRRRYTRYILQDLSSSGGTLVNGYSVQEIVLRAGDVITLAGYDLIYAEDQPAQRTRASDTRPYPVVEES